MVNGVWCVLCVACAFVYLLPSSFRLPSSVLPFPSSSFLLHPMSFFFFRFTSEDDVRRASAEFAARQKAQSADGGGEREGEGEGGGAGGGEDGGRRGRQERLAAVEGESEGSKRSQMEMDLARPSPSAAGGRGGGGDSGISSSGGRSMRTSSAIDDLVAEEELMKAAGKARRVVGVGGKESRESLERRSSRLLQGLNLSWGLGDTPDERGMGGLVCEIVLVST